MKISGPGGPGPSLPADAGKAVDEAKAPAEKEFAARVGTAPPAGAAAGATPPPAVGAVADIVADLRAGKISAETAVDRVIDRVLAQQVGPHAPPAVRELVGAALRQALEDDPLLAEKLRALE